MKKPSELAPLSSEDEKKPYSKYYYMGPGQPDKETLEAIKFGKPLKEADCLHPDEVYKLLEPGYLPHENGYCVFENGVGYAAVLSKMPGVTPEANNWWGPWHEQDDLRYKIWCPGAHQRVGTHWAQEDVGMGLEDIYMTERLAPQLIGISDAKAEADKSLVVMRVSNWLSKPVGADASVRPMPTVVIHDIRKIEDGIEYRSRFYIGMHYVRGKAKVMLPGGVPCSEERAFGMAYHAEYEFATLRRILQPLYEEYGPGI